MDETKIDKFGKTEEEIKEEKRATVISLGMRYIVDDDINNYLDGLWDKLDDLSNGSNPSIAIKDAETKGQIFAVKHILSVFAKYK